jgi:hypothetical protein
MFGGEKMKGTDLPQSVVGLTFIRDGMFYGCTGALISDKLILTAAHCLYRGTDLRVYFFADELTKQSPYVHARQWQRTIIGWKMPDQFVRMYTQEPQSTNRYDIAIARLNSEAPEGTRSFDVPRYDYSENWMMVAGFGFQGLDMIMQKSIGTMEGRWGWQSRLPSPYEGIMRLDVSNGVGTCDGDSGGPVFVHGDKGRYLLLGLTNSRMRPPDAPEGCKHTSLVVEVAQWFSWIQSKSAELLKLKNQPQIF